MIGNPGGYKTYRCDRIGHLTVESQRGREIALNRGFQAVFGLRPSAARALGEALIAAADNAEPDHPMNPKQGPEKK